MHAAILLRVDTLLRGIACVVVGLCLARGAEAQSFAGAVAAATPEATAAGVEILEAGGNAVDAAIAVQFALAVTEPAMSGLGGGTQVLLKLPGAAPIAINGTTFAPAALPAAPSAEQLRTGRTAATIPSTVRVMEFLHRRYGSGRVTWSRLLQPAIRFAVDGWVVGPFRDRVYRRHEEDLRRDATVARLFLDADLRAPREGDLVRMPVLAETLRRLATHGGMDFYNGGIAADIAADMAANGGWITAEDLARFPEPAVSPALAARYRGYEVHSSPPPAGGWVMLQALNLLAQAPLADLAKEDDARRLTLLRALRLAHGSRAAAPIGYPSDYASEVAGHLSESRAEELWRGAGGETTHYSVVDGDGMAVAVTTSIDSYFGARAASARLGFLYNNYMQAFETGQPGHAFALAPGRAPLSSMSPAIVTRAGEAVLVVGSPGSARIISAVAQVVSHYVDIGTGVASAVAATRVHALPDDRAYVEARSLSPTLLGGMAELGLTLVQPQQDLVIDGLNAYFGGVHAIGLESLGWRAAADPRRDGSAGYADARSVGAAGR